MKKIYLLALLALCTCSQASATYLDAKIVSGKLKGYSQTPQGGSAGSTSIERPSFHELDMNYDTMYQLEVGHHINYFTIYGQYHRIHLKGSKTLRSNLVTHALPIAAGNQFEASFDFDWYTFGAAYTYPLSSLLIVPSVDLNYLEYDYRFSSTASSSRSFSTVAPRFGLRLSYPINPLLTVNLSGAMTVLSELQITETNLSLDWLAIDDRIKVTPYAGLGMLKVDFEDSQAVPNHYRYKLLPNVSLGVRVLF
jgi:hypothetical protein